MAQPEPYDRQNNFTAALSGTGNATLGADLDEEFNAARQTIERLRLNLERLQRDDLALANGIVGLDQLTEEVILRLGSVSGASTDAAFCQFVLGATAAITRSVQSRLREYYTPGDFGVVDDPTFLTTTTNDQYTKLQAWANACMADGRMPACPLPTRVYSSQPIVWNTSTVSSAARFYSMDLSNLRICTTANAGWIQGDDALPTDFIQAARMPHVNRRTIDWTQDYNTQCGGIILKNHTNCVLFPGRVFGFTVGFQHWAGVGKGSAYNTIIGGSFIDNRLDEQLLVAGSGGYVNENVFIGGNCNYSSSSLSRSADFCAGTYCGSATGVGESLNNNRWYGRNYEMTTTSWASVTEGIPIYINGSGSQNIWQHSRCEGHNGPLMHVAGNIDGDANSTQGLHNEANFSFLGSSSTYDAVREVKGAFGNLVSTPRQTNATEWHSGPLRNKMWSGGGNDFRVAAPFTLRSTTSGTDARNINAAGRFLPNIFGICTNVGGQCGPGFWLDVSRWKQIEFRADTLPGFGGRWFFKAYDANFTALGNTTTDAWGTQRAIRFPGCTTTTTGGGGWTEGSDQVIALRVSLSEEVKWLYVAKAGGTAALVINGYSFTAYARSQTSAGANSYGPPMIFDPLFDGEDDTGRTASANPGSAGVIGFYNRGRKIWNNAAASGVTSGWICNSGGVLAPSRADATAYATKGRILLNSSGNAYFVHVPGTTGTGTEPTGTTPGTDYVDGTVTWRYVGPKATFTADANIP